MPAILQANAEFTGYVNPRLIRETHAGLQRCGITVHEVGRLMPIQSYAMSGRWERPGK